MPVVNELSPDSPDSPDTGQQSFDPAYTSIAIANFSSAPICSNLTLNFGPFNSRRSNSINPSIAVPGVIVDLYKKTDVVPSVGAAAFTGASDNSGIVSISFTNLNEMVFWIIRITYPIGTYDPLQPGVIFTFYDKFE